MGGRHYTVVAFPGNENDMAAVKVINDDIQQPSEGKARLRVINAAPDTPQIDIVTTKDKDTLFDDVDFREASSYKEVEPTTGIIELRSEDGKRVLAQPKVTLEPGRSYTVVVAGKATGSPRLRAIVIEDRVMDQANTN
jgi:Domain of unknown function (DUF4397)